RDLLVRTLEHPEFVDGLIDTGFYDRHDPAELGRGLADDTTAQRLAIAAALTAAGPAPTVGETRYNYRNVGDGWVTRSDAGDAEWVIELGQPRAGGFQARVDHDAMFDVALTGSKLRVGDSEMYSVTVDHDGADWWIDSNRGSVHLVELPRFPEAQSSE